MLKLTKTLSVGLCATMLMFSCSKDVEDVSPSSTLSGDYANAAKPSTTVANSFLYSDISTTDGGTTWMFTVKRDGSNTGANANVVVLGLMGCGDPAQPIALSAANVTSMTVQKEGGAVQSLDLAFADNSANACSMAATPNYVSFTEFEGNLKDGSVYTFKVTLNTPVQVTMAYVGVRAGNECFPGTMIGPGCITEEDLCGEGHGAFHKEDSWEGNTVTLGNETYTEAEGLALMNPNLGGGNKNVAFAFSQGATVLLNRELGLISEGAYESQMAAINTYLANFAKLTEASAATLYDDSPEATAAKRAAGYIGDHIKCDDGE